MDLEKGYSKRVIERNIKKLVYNGKTQNEAAKIAMEKAREKNNG